MRKLSPTPFLRVLQKSIVGTFERISDFPRAARSNRSSAVSHRCIMRGCRYRHRVATALRMPCVGSLPRENMMRSPSSQHAHMT